MVDELLARPKLVCLAILALILFVVLWSTYWGSQSSRGFRIRYWVVGFVFVAAMILNACCVAPQPANVGLCFACLQRHAPQQGYEPMTPPNYDGILCSGGPPPQKPWPIGDKNHDGSRTTPVD